MISKEFELALCRHKDLFVRFPNTNRAAEELINAFEEQYGVPQIVRAIAGCHIEINAPFQNKEDYFNRKQH